MSFERALLKAVQAGVQHEALRYAVAKRLLKSYPGHPGRPGQVGGSASLHEVAASHGYLPVRHGPGAVAGTYPHVYASKDGRAALTVQEDAHWERRSGAKHYYGQGAEALHQHLLGHVRKADHAVEYRGIDGLRIGIENPGGSIRHWGDAADEQLPLSAPYGFLDGVAGMDGDSTDVFLGPQWAEAQTCPVVVVAILKRPEFDELDEEKVFLGYPDEESALRSFLEHFDQDARFIGHVTVLPWAGFRARVQAAQDVTKAGRPDQPRDAHGRWALESEPEGNPHFHPNAVEPARDRAGRALAVGHQVATPAGRTGRIVSIPMFSNYVMLRTERRGEAPRYERHDPAKVRSLEVAEKGYPGHAGRPGMVGGSAPRGATEQTPTRLYHPGTKQPLTKTQAGDIGEHLAAVVGRAQYEKHFGCCFEGQASGAGGSIRQGPFDAIIGKHAVEIKTISSRAANQKTAIRRKDAIDKQRAARKAGLQPTTVVQRVDQEARRVDVFVLHGFVSKRIGPRTPAFSFKYSDARFNWQKHDGPVRKQGAVDQHGEPIQADDLILDFDDQGRLVRYDASDLAKAEIEAVPDGHQVGMVVPEGGSSCATCEYLRDGNHCANEFWQAWSGTNVLPAPADEYCCDFYELEVEAEKSYPDHPGRPGQVGGSLPRGAGDQQPKERKKREFKGRVKRGQARKWGGARPGNRLDEHLRRTEPHLTPEERKALVKQAAKGQGPHAEKYRELKWNRMAERGQWLSRQRRIAVFRGGVIGGARVLHRQPAEPLPPPKPYERVDEQRLANGALGEHKLLGGGITRSFVATIDGNKVVIKSDRGGRLEDRQVRRNIPKENDPRQGSSHREVAAFKVNEALGRLVDMPVVIQRDLDGAKAPDDKPYGVVTIMDFRQGKNVGSYMGWQKVDQGDLGRMGLFDAIIGAEDRHYNNAMVNGGRLIAIDHGLAFPLDNEGAGGNYNTIDMRSRRLDSGEIQRLQDFRATKDTVDKDLEPWLLPEQRSMMWERVDKMIEGGRVWHPGYGRLRGAV